MALSKLSGDEQRIIFSQLSRNVLDARVAVAFSSASSELRQLTQAERQPLQAGYQAAAALGRKAGMQSCKELREAKIVDWCDTGLSSDDLALLGTLGSVLPALEQLDLHAPAAGADGVQRLAVQLGAGALPAVTVLQLVGTHVGDAGASALAAALGRGALPRLKCLVLARTAIGDAGLLALAPALRRLPALEYLVLRGNQFSVEGLAALVAPPAAAGAPPPAAGAPPAAAGAPPAAAGAPPAAAGAPPAAAATGGLAKLKELGLSSTQITDAGCATLAAALDSGALPALQHLHLFGIPASAPAKRAVYAARAGLQ